MIKSREEGLRGRGWVVRKGGRKGGRRVGKGGRGGKKDGKGWGEMRSMWFKQVSEFLKPPRTIEHSSIMVPKSLY